MLIHFIICPLEHTVVSVDLVKSWIEEERSKLEEQCMTSMLFFLQNHKDLYYAYISKVIEFFE